MTEEQWNSIELFLTENVVAFAGNVASAILILIVGWWLARHVGRLAERAIERSPRIDTTLKPLASSLIRYAILAITVLMVLGRFGVETTSIVAMLGAAGLAIGLALQGTLSNVAAGVMLLVLRPFNVGDAIEVAGRSGTVKVIGLFTVELANFDNLWVSIPNSQVWGSAIVNFTRNPIRRIDLTIGIDYEDDIDKAMALAMEELVGDESILEEPAPMVAVKALGESSVDLAIRGHAKIDVFWPTLFGLQKKIKQRFDREGITIPFPQRTLHVPAGVQVPQLSGNRGTTTDA